MAASWFLEVVSFKRAPILTLIDTFPPGNTYLIENISNRDAKLFFTQARKVPMNAAEKEARDIHAAETQKRKSMVRSSSAGAPSTVPRPVISPGGARAKSLATFPSTRNAWRCPSPDFGLVSQVTLPLSFLHTGFFLFFYTIDHLLSSLFFASLPGIVFYHPLCSLNWHTIICLVSIFNPTQRKVARRHVYTVQKA